MVEVGFSFSSPGDGAGTGAAGGDLTGNYPNPTLGAGVVNTTELADGAVTAAKAAADMATQAELDNAYNFATTVAVAEKTANYTFVNGDQAIPQAFHMNLGTALTLTVPANATVAFAVGTCFEVTRMGAGSVTIAAAGGVTIRSAGAILTLRAQYSTATLRKIATDEWLLAGDLG